MDMTKRDLLLKKVAAKCGSTIYLDHVDATIEAVAQEIAVFTSCACPDDEEAPCCLKCAITRMVLDLRGRR